MFFPFFLPSLVDNTYELQREIENLKWQLEDANWINSRLQRKKDLRGNLVAKLQEENDHLNEELGVSIIDSIILSYDLEDANNRIDALTAEVERLEAQNKFLAELGPAKTPREAQLESYVKDLNTVTEFLLDELDAADEEIDDLKFEIELQEEEIDLLNEEIDSLEGYGGSKYELGAAYA